MWLFTRHGFFSVTCPRSDACAGPLDQSRVQVRARVRDHLEALISTFPDAFPKKAAILDTPDGDYCCRTFISRAAWRKLVRVLADDVTYGNFKNAAGRKFPIDGPGYVTALHRIWRTMYGVQEKASGPGKYSTEPRRKRAGSYTPPLSSLFRPSSAYSPAHGHPDDQTSYDFDESEPGPDEAPGWWRDDDDDDGVPF